MKTLSRLFFVLCIMFASISCVATHERFHGNAVANEDIIVLQNGEEQIASWKTFDVIINLNYVLDGDNLELFGEGQLGEHYSAIYTHIRSLTVYLFLLDKQGDVLETVPVRITSMWYTDDKFTINQSIKLPELATGLSFGYSGTVAELGSGRAIDSSVSFHKLPLTKGSSEM